MPELTMQDVNNELSNYLTEKGIQLWWVRPAWQLDGEMPMHAWRKDREAVMNYARGGREMTAT